MKQAIAAVLAGVALAGCDTSAEPKASQFLGYQVDAAHERSWWLTKDGVVLHSARDPAKSIALPDWLWLAAPYCPPAIAVGPAGEALVTSNATGTLWRIDARTLAVTVHPLDLGADAGRDVGFAAIAYSPEQKAFVAYSEQRSVWKIDPALGRATRIADADLSRSGPQRVRTLRTPCADLAQRLGRLANTND